MMVIQITLIIACVVLVMSGNSFFGALMFGLLLVSIL
jgi:hypothetical protein